MKFKDLQIGDVFRWSKNSMYFISWDWKIRKTTAINCQCIETSCTNVHVVSAHLEIDVELVESACPIIE